ncbi:hypothetical protein TRIP_C90257 [Candidatus Zixiibacteriota bacterium]|nr:hypothetical protein TRIP_C90257 [candidate division Zixibacteria bacterium]
MQTALHIYSLVRELSDRLIGAVVSGTEFYKKERVAFIMFKTDDGTLALGLAYHPVGFGSFLIPRGKIEIKSDEKPWPFFQIVEKGKVISIRQFGLDRIFQIDIESENKKFGIIVEAIGPHGNIWLVDSENKILATLRNKKFDDSSVYLPPPPLDRLNPLQMTLAQFEESLAAVGEISLEQFLKKNIQGMDDNLVEEIILKTGLRRESPAGETHHATAEELHREFLQLASRFENYHHGYIYTRTGRILVYPFKLHSLGDDFTKAKSLSIAIYEMITANKENKIEVSEQERVIDTVTRFAGKLEKKEKNIEDDLHQADRSDIFKKYAEILKINLPSVRKGMKAVELHDIYGAADATITIPLNPALNAAANADDYFKRYRKGKESLSLLERRLEIARKELKMARIMLEELERDFDHASQKYASEIFELLPKETVRREKAPRLPYRAHTLSTGVTIFIGKDGADNDATTFGHAKPYELWFHTAQCPGSHVVLKFPDKNFQPSKNEIAETAAIAAYHSKARHSKTVPVIYTERRYVRKPRGAKPGLVTVEREKMVMVEPKKNE